MRSLALLIIVSSLFLLFFHLSEKCSENKNKKYVIAPNFKFTSIQNQSIQLYDLKGKKVILTFWASWCPPCKKEIPILAELAKNNNDIIIIAISIDQNKNDVTKFLSKFSQSILDSLNLGNVFVALDEEKKIAQLYQSYKYPETYLINENMKIEKKVSGIISKKDIAAMLSKP